MIKYFVIIIVLGFICESLSWFLRLFKVYFWIKKERLDKQNNFVTTQKIYILIPVLAEMDIIKDTADYFNVNFLIDRKDTFLVFITSEKENVISKVKENTIYLANSLAQQNKKIIHIHFPKKEGKMAHQLNYAIDELTQKSSYIKNGDLIVIYNADSRPEKETFDWVRGKFKEGNINIFQQYGCYCENILQINNLSWKSTLVSASLWQTRWALGFEIYNALKQLKSFKGKEKMRLNYPFNYCIGHGLFITPKMLREVGGFNENTHNEDAVLGLQLSDRQELIMPVPYFDISESPDSILMLYKQKANWYFGPLQAYSYAVNINKKTGYGKFKKIRLYLLSTKLFFHAIFWILGPTLMVVVLILAIINHNIIIILLSLLSMILFAAPNIVSYEIIFRLGIKQASFSFLRMISILFRGFFIFYMIHGSSAYGGLYKYLSQILSGKEAVKEKTMVKRT